MLVPWVAGSQGVAGADAVHLATALRMHADYLLTTDLKLLRKLHQHNDIGPARVDHLVVQQPELVWVPDIFESREDEQDREAEQRQAQKAAAARPSARSATSPDARNMPRCGGQPSLRWAGGGPPALGVGVLSADRW